MIPDKSKPKPKALGNGYLTKLIIGPLFRLRVPNFKSMNEKYKRKLEELGYPTDQPADQQV